MEAAQVMVFHGSRTSHGFSFTPPGFNFSTMYFVRFFYSHHMNKTISMLRSSEKSNTMLQTTLKKATFYKKILQKLETAASTQENELLQDFNNIF